MTEGGTLGDRLRLLAARVVRVVGGVPAVRTLMATLAVYDQAGGGLVASGLAYSALLGLVPGMLLLLSTVGFVLDPALRDRIADAIGAAVPPLDGVVRSALDSVAAGAVPTSIAAAVGLVWGSSRFYAALDGAFARVFDGERRRSELQRTARGLVVTALVTAVPIAALLAGSVISWLLDLAPPGVALGGAARWLWQVVTPVASVVLFVVAVSLVYRYVPPRPVPAAAFMPPAILVGLATAVFTQLFTFIAPRLIGWAALYGAFVAVFALLAWLSIGCNLLLLGASWTRVRAPGTSTDAGGGADVAAPDRRAARGSSGGARVSGRVSPGACRSGGRSGRWPRARDRS